MTTVVFDLDGVVYLGEEPVPGARQTLTCLSMDHLVLFCTNNSSKTRRQTADKIRRVVGFETDPDMILTSATATGQLVGPEDGPALAIGGDGISEMLLDRAIAMAADHTDARLVVAGIDHDLSYDRLATATLAIRKGARFVATNDDRTYPTPEGQLPGAGAIVAALEAASGQKAEVAGKPHTPMRNLIKSLADDGEIWMVGDRPDTDLAMAEMEGWTSVLVLTGVVRDPMTSSVLPTHVLDSIAGLCGIIDGSVQAGP